MKKVKDISRISGLSKRTLQYYDEKELLSVKRSKENYRLYDDEDLERLLLNLSEDDTKNMIIKGHGKQLVR